MTVMHGLASEESEESEESEKASLALSASKVSLKAHEGSTRGGLCLSVGNQPFNASVIHPRGGGQNDRPRVVLSE